MSRITSFSEWLLRQPFVWGGFACLTFYATIVHGASKESFLGRYFAGHEVEYVTTALFFIGIAALVIKLLGLAVQFASLGGRALTPIPEGGQAVEDAEQLLRQVDELPAALQGGYLARRLREALDYVQRKGSADNLEQHLLHLEDVDSARIHHSYASVRIIVAIIPILGFLGTVIGITLAIAKLSGESMDTQLPAVISGLSVAFDTTALALALSIVLLFAKFLVERVEIHLQTEVDAQATELLVGRFRQYGNGTDPHLASVRRMSEQLLDTVQAATQEQSQFLMKSFGEANRHWSSVAANVGDTLEQTMTSVATRGLALHAEALNRGVAEHARDLEETLIRHAELLNEGLEQHTTAMIEAEKLVAEENRRHLAEVESAVGEAMLVSTSRQEKLIRQAEKMLQEMQSALVDAAGTSVAQQEQLIKQGDILLKVVEATGQVKKLEDSLNCNLAALAGSHHFEQTVVGLSAALQLLSSRLGQPLDVASEVFLTDAPSADGSQQPDETPTEGQQTNGTQTSQAA